MQTQYGTVEYYKERRAFAYASRAFWRVVPRYDWLGNTPAQRVTDFTDAIARATREIERLSATEDKLCTT